jgi:HSP20 family protein
MKADDPRTWMWARALEVLSDAERLHRQFFHLGHAVSRRPAWEPPVDIFEAEGALHVIVALPGVSPERLRVYSDGNALVISGDRPVPSEGRAGTIHRMEIPHGHFERRIEGLPPGLEPARSDLRDGCLFLTFPKG